MAYDEKGRLNTITQTAPGAGTRTATLEWCDCGSLDSLTYPSGFKISYERNDDGQITAIKKLDGGSTTTLAAYTYDSAGRLTTRTLANGVVTSYNYDAVGNVTSIVVTKSGSTPVVLWSNTYGYDDLNRRTYTKWADGKGDAYHYDATSQVIGVKYSGTNPEAGFGSISGVATTATWNYDIAGNRTAQVINSATTTYTVNDIKQYVTVDSGSLTYNTRGDLLTHGDWTLAYDAFGHLITATGTSGDVHKYFYDAGGTRVGKQLHGEHPVFYFHVGFDRLEDVHTSNGDVVSYIYEPGIDRPLAMIDAAGGVTFFHQDVLGNVVALTSGTGTLIQQYRYTVWGEPQVFNASNQSRPFSEARSPFLFTAREYDVETRLYHYRARAYSPQLGRFLQFDPIDFAGGDLSVICYDSNSPLPWKDPDGKRGRRGSRGGSCCGGISYNPTRQCCVNDTLYDKVPNYQILGFKTANECVSSLFNECIPPDVSAAQNAAAIISGGYVGIRGPNPVAAVVIGATTCVGLALAGLYIRAFCEDTVCLIRQ